MVPRRELLVILEVSRAQATEVAVWITQLQSTCVNRHFRNGTENSEHNGMDSFMSKVGKDGGRGANSILWLPCSPSLPTLFSVMP